MLLEFLKSFGNIEMMLILFWILFSSMTIEMTCSELAHSFSFANEGKNERRKTNFQESSKG
jgi:glutaminase